MKNTINNLIKAFAILLLVGTTYTVSAQPPPPPAGEGGSGGSQGNQLGGNAPIGGGLFILLGLGAAYAGRKVYSLRAEEKIA
ncbi:MAG: hypothetical protein DRI89_11110 [Bacteroidetes bacterium]|nr:MAG: hypothetical protein DRI89_11110 [Bacteroidota bacterium]